MRKREKLKRLNQEIRNCKKCLLRRTRKKAVPGEGPIAAKLIIIGQAPGTEENKIGKPFVGRAGQFLNHLLEIAKIRRESVFITSPIKCFPPKNRKPTKKEIDTCFPYLKKQIGIINPQRFILLGEIAFSVFFPSNKLKNFRGKWIKKDNKNFFVTYHPAAGLRFPKIREILVKDFERLKTSKKF